MKTNLLVNNEVCEQEETPACTDDGILFGPKTGQKVVLNLADGETIRLDGFLVTADINIYLLDRDTGIECVDCGTGYKIPYAPCGNTHPKKLSSANRIEYIRGPGVFELYSQAIAGTQFVKMRKVNNIHVDEFCKRYDFCA